MKKAFFLLLLFSCINAFSQNSFIVSTDGKKTIIRDDKVEIILIDKRISYTEVGKTWEKYIRYKDLDYAIIGSHYLKSYRLYKNKPEIYFVLTEQDDKTLISSVVTVTSTSGHYSSSRTYYEINVIDSKNKIIEGLSFTDKNSKDQVELRLKIAPLIKKHFPNCTRLLDNLDEFESTDKEDNTMILGFFNSQDYVKCK